MSKKVGDVSAHKETRILLSDVRDLIQSARQTVARGVNAALVMLYWKIGERIRLDVLNEKRAEYGNEIVATLSRQLSEEFGVGFAEKSLRRMVQFAEAFPDEEIILGLSKQLGWSHFVELIPLKKPLQRDFYAEMCRVEHWTVRALRKKIGGMLYERTALSKKPEKLAELEIKELREEDKLTPDLVFRDPYFLDFLDDKFLVLKSHDYDVARSSRICRDPIGEEGGLNLYGYVGNNPINVIDPLGLVNLNLNIGSTAAIYDNYGNYKNNSYYTVAGHSDGHFVSDDTVAGTPLTPEMLGNLIKSDPNYHGQPIKLYSCNTGSGGDNSFAAKLSNYLNGAPIIAPNNVVWGEEVAPRQSNDPQSPSYNTPDRTKSDRWVKFAKGKEVM